MSSTPSQPESGRHQCARWAKCLWTDGKLGSPDNHELAAALRSIACGQSPSVALRIVGRPPNTPYTLPTADPPLSAHLGSDVASEAALLLADTSPAFARELFAVIGRGVQAAALLPEFVLRFLAASLIDIANGADAAETLRLLASKGRHEELPRDLEIARIAEFARSVSGDSDHTYRWAAILADIQGLTQTKGRSKTLTAKQMRNIHRKVQGTS